jgi:predicted ester cyclase
MYRIFVLVALLAAAGAVQPQHAVNPAGNAFMPTQTALTKHKQVVTELFGTCFNEGRIELLPDLIAADYHGPNGQSGPPGFAATITQIRATITGIHYTLDELVAESDRVAVRWHWEGIQDGPFRGFPATHKHVTSNGMAIFQFKDDKIIHAWLQMDQLGFLQQIGALPTEIKPSAQPQTNGPAQP